MEIQVLDDSSDGTVELVRTYMKNLGTGLVDIKHIRRKNRVGFKVGALENGLKTAKGDFIAIFDADFIPYPEFLLKTVPNFGNPKIAAVQTRWHHVNKDYSLLTKIQALALDVHFSVG